MKNLKTASIGLLFLGLSLSEVQATKLYVNEKGGAETVYSLSNIQKMTFSNGNTIIEKKDKSTETYALSDLTYLRFEDMITAFADQNFDMGTDRLVTYPNPVRDVLRIDLGDASAEGTVSILNLEGEELHSQATTKGLTTLNLGELSDGVYLCRYSTSNEVKTVKIIKE